ncbi:MAG: cadherin-like domain-containing protein, partial [Mycobacteriales bacterium]
MTTVSQSGFTLTASPATFTLSPQTISYPCPSPTGTCLQPSVGQTPGSQTITITAKNTGLVPTFWQFGQVTFTPATATKPVQHFPVAVKTKGGAPAQSCVIPFTTVATDPSEVNVAPANDIREIGVAGVFPTFGGQPMPNVTFRMKVASLSPLPPESHWRIAFVPPGAPAGTQYYVQMINGTSGDPSFVYGTLAGGSFTNLGAAEAGSWAADGTILITLATAKFLNPGVGATLTGITGASGPAIPGTLTTNTDSTSAGAYTLRTCASTGPQANDDSATTAEDTAVRINVLANDTDPGGSALTVTAVSTPSAGTAVNNGDGTVTYTPNRGFSGSDTFGYTIRNTAGQTDDGIVTVIVEPRCPPGRFTDTLEPAAKPGWTV